MRVPAAYLGVVLITSTMPLAVQWSGDGSGFLFGITSRIVVSAVLAIALLGVLRLSMIWTRQACLSYLAVGLGVFGSMLAVHWSAQFIPSGWIAVLTGLAPILTGIMAVIWANEPSFSAVKLTGIVLGLCGLMIIFGQSMELGESALYGVGGMLLAVLCRSASSVWLKRIHMPINGLIVTTGGLLVATPLYLLVWFCSGNSWPTEISMRTAISIIYLAVFANLVGFVLYYYLLRNINLARVELITLISPVCALLLGAQFNNEVVSGTVWLGAAMVLSGLACFEFDRTNISKRIQK